MRQFYSVYSENVKLQPLVGEISWAKNLVIMSRCKEALEREFYLRMTREEIGSYLGLKLETVSRTLSKLAEDRIIAIHRRQIDIINPDGLQRIVNAAACR